MRQKSQTRQTGGAKAIKDIRRATRKQYSAEEKIRIVLDGLRGEETIAELCRREGIAQSIYYKWSKEFLEAGKRRLAGDTARAASTGEVTALRREARELKEVVAEQTLELRLLKKSMIADGGDDERDTPHLKSLRSFTLLNVLTCQSNRRWISWVFPAPRFIVGTIAISLVVRRTWKINRPGHHASGIVCLTSAPMEQISGIT